MLGFITRLSLLSSMVLLASSTSYQQDIIDDYISYRMFFIKGGGLDFHNVFAKRKPHHHIEREFIQSFDSKAYTKHLSSVMNKTRDLDSFFSVLFHTHFLNKVYIDYSLLSFFHYYVFSKEISKVHFIEESEKVDQTMSLISEVIPFENLNKEIQEKLELYKSQLTHQINQMKSGKEKNLHETILSRIKYIELNKDKVLSHMQYRMISDFRFTEIREMHRMCKDECREYIKKFLNTHLAIESGMFDSKIKERSKE